MSPSEATYVVFVASAGLAMGSLGMLMIGHLMNEHWLAPIRSEAEASALTAPLVLLVGLPLAFQLDALFPWASGEVALPPGRATYLTPGFFLLRSVFYLVATGVVALWVARTASRRLASALGLAILTPVMTFAAYDWVLSRDPRWWSSLFGFAYSLSQLQAALAGAILVALLKPDHASTKKMLSLERALLTLSLLAVWTWFAQFLIVWLTDLPEESAWYLARAGRASLLLLAGAAMAILAAIVLLVPTGVSRVAMIAGSVLVLVHHALHMVWVLKPGRAGGLADVALAFAGAAAWLVAFFLLDRWRARAHESEADADRTDQGTDRGPSEDGRTRRVRDDVSPSGAGAGIGVERSPFPASGRRGSGG